MDILKLLSHFEGFDADVYDRFDTRRKAMSRFADIGKKLTMASFPLAASAMINKAYGGTNDDVNSALQLALKAEYLEAHFYVLGVQNSAALGMSADLAAGIQRIAYDELLHVEAVRATLASFETPQVPYLGPKSQKPGDAQYGIDVTGGGGADPDAANTTGNGNGPFKAALSSLAVYLAAAQVFEDNGVRAYKGQAGNIFPNKTVLAAGLGIHSVEARHASYLRRVRAKMASATNPINPFPWITNDDPGNVPEPYNTKVKPVYGPSATDAANYPSEANTTQAGIDITSLGVTAAQASAAFDEPIDGDTVVKFLTGQVDPQIIFIY